jgi:hypothetical protein
MSQWLVQVDVCLQRPVRTQDHFWYQLEAETALDAELTACQWAAMHGDVVMPTGSVVLDWQE